MHPADETRMIRQTRTRIKMTKTARTTRTRPACNLSATKKSTTSETCCDSSGAQSTPARSEAIVAKTTTTVRRHTGASSPGCSSCAFNLCISNVEDANDAYSLFLGVAAYLIFGSWLNYSQYGARGWDLLPHGDTLRDIPYAVKEYIRSVIGAIQGNGSRGGYSAV